MRETTAGSPGIPTTPLLVPLPADGMAGPGAGFFPGLSTPALFLTTQLML